MTKGGNKCGLRHANMARDFSNVPQINAEAGIRENFTKHEGVHSILSERKCYFFSSYILRRFTQWSIGYISDVQNKLFFPHGQPYDSAQYKIFFSQNGQNKKLMREFIPRSQGAAAVAKKELTSSSWRKGGGGGEEPLWIRLKVISKLIRCWH